MVKEKKKSEKKVMPKLYKDSKIDKIQMPSCMIRTQVEFVKIWKGNIEASKIEDAWSRAEKWRDSYK